MIATMTVQSSRMAQPQDRRFSPSSNTAGAPLPLIPRRISSSRPAHCSSLSKSLPMRASASSPSLSSASSSSSTVTMVAPPANDSDISSSSSPSSDEMRPTIRTRRVRGVRANGVVCPPELSTPMPTLTLVSSSSQPHIFPSKPVDAPQVMQSRPLLYTPGMPLRSASRNISESTHVSHSSESSTYQSGSQSASALCETYGEARMIRKKSGQVVKSSLKSSRSLSRSDNLSVITMSPTSKSEPTTPTSKAVHFDAKLEHVKLFLSEQKPLAVSRDGSPTDDTSGTDSDFPRFIFGTDQAGEGGDGRRVPKKKLVMQVANMPARRAGCTDEVALEALCLAPDGASILGTVRVRNLAFAKCVAVRFTFDAWQTTSEVIGKYLDSPSPQFDRFGFAIRLNDLLARIEGKTLLLAVKYSIGGREMWDNNGGQNYLVTFAKTKVEEPSVAPPPKRPTTLSDDEASTDMMDLRSKLEKVVNPKDRTGPAFNVAQQSPSSFSTPTSSSSSFASWSSGSGRGGAHQHSAASSVDPDGTPSFRTSSSFAARYDFAASLKRPWNPDALHHAYAAHSRTQSFPLSGTSSAVPWPQKSPSDPYAFRRPPAAQQQHTPAAGKTLGSPRDLGEDAFRLVSPRPLTAEMDSPLPPQHARGRHHQRGGYFDMGLPSGLPGAFRRTPPGTPQSPFSLSRSGLPPVSSPPGRYNSFPPMDAACRRDGADNDLLSPSEYADSSELSTPSMVTPSSSRESTPSPSPTEFLEEAGMSPETHYRYFLNKFCFFTGPGSALDADASELPRTHSASDIEEFLSGHSFSPHLQAAAADGHGHQHDLLWGSSSSSSPSRSSSMDDIALNRSGSLTPTISRLGLAPPPAVGVVSPTPVLL
ncbi:putative phosphatase regulatory subunit-domain-containing protein [Pholiota molesta]|nr:putative phosphatase regulatory subunit-domain-containing protein [Pholiota molesta]